MPDAGSFDIGDQILVGGVLWEIVERDHVGRLTIGREQDGRIRLDTIGPYEDVERPMDVIEDLNRRITLAEIDWRASRKYSLFSSGTARASATLVELKGRRDRLIAQGVKP